MMRRLHTEYDIFSMGLVFHITLSDIPILSILLVQSSKKKVKKNEVGFYFRFFPP